jgi:hypothetical protein
MSILQSRLKYNKPANAVISPSCLGPFPVSAITDHVRGRLVAQQGHPVILQDGARFAVLAPPNKELRIVCAGCFTPGMSLFDDSKCKKVSSYSQHWDTRKGDRKESCKAVGYDSLENCIQRVNANTIKDDEVGDVVLPVVDLPEDPEEEVATLSLTPTQIGGLLSKMVDKNKALRGEVNNLELKIFKMEREKIDKSGLSKDLSTLSTGALVQELASRNALMEAVVHVDTDELAATAKERGIKLLIDGRFEDLEAEMRRIADPTRPAIDSYYFKAKVAGVPHVSDAPLVTVESFVPKATRNRERAPRKGYETRSKQGPKRYKLRRLK